MKATYNEIKQVEEHLVQAEKLLRVLSNRHRLKVICQLLDKELTAGELEQRLSISQSALSHHLAKLRNAGLVVFRREGNALWYRLQGNTAPGFLLMLHSLLSE